MANSFNSTDILTSLIKKDQFYKNQISAAKQIVTHFETEHYVLLSAQMQSGKTGCALYCAFDMLFSKKVDSVFIVSGTSDTDLRKQWELKCATHLFEYCSMHDIHDEEIIFNMNKIISSGIIWRQDLLKSKDKFSERFLIIWDESHFAITENQTLHTFLTEPGSYTAHTCFFGSSFPIRSIPLMKTNVNFDGHDSKQDTSMISVPLRLAFAELLVSMLYLKYDSGRVPPGAQSILMVIMVTIKRN